MMSEIQQGSPEYDVEDLELMQDAGRYRAWVYRLIAPYVGRRVLEVGAGIGNYAEFLLDREALTLMDCSTGCYTALVNRFASQDSVRVVQMDICDPVVLTLRDYPFDTVICLDVLEHTDDVVALRHMNALLSSGGTLIVKVPALQALHGTIDQALGHHRRYRRQELLGRLKEAGFHAKRHQYLNPIGAIGWWVNAHLLRRRKQSRLQIRFFDRFVVPFSSWLEGRWPPPFGQSLLAICRKVTEVAPQ
jgi:SAM-dependent methyltransferase